MFSAQRPRKVFRVELARTNVFDRATALVGQPVLSFKPNLVATTECVRNDTGLHVHKLVSHFEGKWCGYLIYSTHREPTTPRGM